ncbi:hypothetical protein [Deinococcus gobiensis]|uniref:Lipoprotein n=1 Tax=Deinococcus gobiensis (strain DSM 21396 / JCM 16679 / CGMCC 1.7299 / I-0) TaxID=745776 RepID=H8GUA6_DEIGI|nr:hypothetical protein [Deinococcus gobiensis]AFD25430.1 hypothetical protein DGo_CA1503 [Deinococcus gobiensis I-0]
MHKLLPLALPLLLAACSPALLERAGQAPSPSAPLAAGQSWRVEGMGRLLGSSVTIALPQVLNVRPGVYSNLSLADLSAAEQGRGESKAALALNTTGSALLFYWNDGGTDYQCRVANPDPGGQSFRGILVANDTRLGTCTASWS